jgi:hypothetical protein
MVRRGLIVATACALLAACTGSGTGSPTGSSVSLSGCQPGEGRCPSQVHVLGETFEVRCSPVAEALVDIELPRDPGEPKLRAIAGIDSAQAVAVRWGQPGGCGLWALGVQDAVSTTTAAAIEDEVRAGVERFGVTASPVPKSAGG